MNQKNNQILEYQKEVLVINKSKNRFLEVSNEVADHQLAQPRGKNKKEVHKIIKKEKQPQTGSN